MTSLRDGQVQAVREIIAAFEESDVVFLDAPVGAGKTLIGELVRRELGVDRGLYICSDKQLQDQFTRDFPYAEVLKGKANYRPTNAIGDITCEDCTAKQPGDSCNWCPETSACPYKVARTAALGEQIRGVDGKRVWSGGARVAVLNTAYFFAAANLARITRKYDLVVVDECDMLESALIGFVEFEVPKWIGDAAELNYPRKSVHKTTIVKWLDEAEAQVTEWYEVARDTLEPKQQRKVTGFLGELAVVRRELQADIDAIGGDDSTGRWVRDYGTTQYPVQTLKLRPVMVQRQGPGNLWAHGTKFLLMSGTVISADEMADSLGLELPWESIDIPSDFPVENRPIILAPVAKMTAKATDDDYADMAYAITQIIGEHEGRILVHSVSYKLTKELRDRVQQELDSYGGLFRHRKLVTYSSGRGKAAAMREYLATPGAVMFAPSMDRGVDFAGDKCEVQVIAKCPFPSLGDKQVSARKGLPGGDQWYQVKTIRDIVQMTGRGVRSKTDECVTYVLDEQFTRNVWYRNERLFPRYFRDAVDAGADIRWLIRPKN